jgi:hypothetical protein
MFPAEKALVAKRRIKSMGIVRMGVPTELVLHLTNLRKCETFVETGTYQGGTAVWAAKRFTRVITVENSRSLYEETRAKFKEIKNIEFRFGDSRTQMAAIVQDLKSSAVFWLDSHWCGGNSYGADDQCPILDELRILNQSDIEHFILIDDARLFLVPPPLPNQAEQWPTITDIGSLLTSGKYERYTVIFEDVILSVPMHAKPALLAWCQEATTKTWHEYGEKLRQENQAPRKDSAKGPFSWVMKVAGAMHHQSGRMKPKTRGTL